jgi:putative glutamine amidotransferase
MKRIGLTLRVEAARERRDCIDQAWYPLLADLDMWPVPLPNLAQQQQPAERMLAALDLAGVILTGGNDISGVPGARSAAPERDRFEHSLLDACSERGTPVLGVCRGLQLLVVHHGGRLRPVDGHVASLHSLIVSPNCPLPLADRDEVNSFHDFGLRPDDLAGPLRATATASDGTVEAVAHEERPQWGIMWHPERAPHDRRDGQILRALFG